MSCLLPYVCLVIWGRDLLKKGLRWRVGNGTNINVFSDPWVPGVLGFCLQARSGVARNMMVSELITPTRGWHLSPLDPHISMAEREAILEIPIIRSSAPDLRIWHFTRNGCYSVKSGYWLAWKERRMADQGTGNMVLAPINYWKHLWKLKVPPKMLHLCGGAPWALFLVWILYIGREFRRRIFVFDVINQLKHLCTQHGVVRALLRCWRG